MLIKHNACICAVFWILFSAVNKGEEIKETRNRRPFNSYSPSGRKVDSIYISAYFSFDKIINFQLDKLSLIYIVNCNDIFLHRIIYSLSFFYINIPWSCFWCLILHKKLSRRQRCHLFSKYVNTRVICVMQASKLVADWSMHWSRDTLLKKLRLYDFSLHPNEKTLWKELYLSRHRYNHLCSLGAFWLDRLKACNESYEEQLPDFYSWALTAGMLLSKVLFFQ